MRRAEEAQRLQAEEVAVLGSSSTGFDPSQAAPPPVQQHAPAQNGTSAPAAAHGPQHAALPFSWSLQPGQQQQQLQPGLGIADQRTFGAASFQFASSPANGMFVFGQSHSNPQQVQTSPDGKMV